VLGPFELTCNDQPVALQLMQITIILALWCARGPVDRDNLIRRIWPVPAPGAWDTLRGHLSRIRAALAAIHGDLDMLILEPTGPVRTFQMMNVASSDAGEFRQHADPNAEEYANATGNEAPGAIRNRWHRSGGAGHSGSSWLRALERGERRCHAASTWHPDLAYPGGPW
jgi:DNA-binding SARP family transcriptional activator